MTTAALLTAVAIALVSAGVVGTVARSRLRIAERLHPYVRTSGPRGPVLDGALWSPRPGGSVVVRVFGPVFGALVAAVWPRGADGRDERLVRRLRDAGLGEVEPDAFRAREIVSTLGATGIGIVLGAVVLHSALLTLVFAVCGGAIGVTRGRSRLEHLADERRTRMRLELVTIDQLLAIHARTGSGPVQAVTRVVERGSGLVVDELRGVLSSMRSGRSEAEAFRHAAEHTVEPHAARTYRLFALAAEQGADLGGALRALSDDLRDVRRDELRRAATRRRAAMLMPTIAVLAPVMLLFVVAPLPSIVLGGR